MGIRDDRMKARALREQWDIPLEKRTKMIEEMIDIVIGEGRTPREKTSAFTAILAANTQNMVAAKENIGIEVDEKPADARTVEGHVISTTEQVGNRFSSVAKRLGLSSFAGGVSEGGAAVDPDAAGAEPKPNSEGEAE